VGNLWVMFFCTAKHSRERQTQRKAWNGTHYYIAHSPVRPFELATPESLLADSVGTLYAARIVEDPWIEPCLLAWRRWDQDGVFAGDIPDPIPLNIAPDGGLSIGT